MLKARYRITVSPPYSLLLCGEPIISKASRRRVLQLAALGAVGLPYQSVMAEDADEASSPPLIQLIAHPLLVASLYAKSVSDNYSDDGAAGVNRSGFTYIEEQRQGAEWIVRGYAERKPEWMQLGWRQLDWGLARQQPDGGFGSKDPFHSTSFFVEALARSCLIDPINATAFRIDGLTKAADWLMNRAIEKSGVPKNQPYTHRRYILAAALGQSAAVTGNETFRRRAYAWAREGVSLQQDDGTNPEKGGFDAGYQMVGVLMALRFLPVCEDAQLRVKLRQMTRRAVKRELLQQRATGEIDMDGSTRIGLEKARNGQTKEVPYGEIMQALVYGAQAVHQLDWLDPARRIAVYKRWIK